MLFELPAHTPAGLDAKAWTIWVYADGEFRMFLLEPVAIEGMLKSIMAMNGSLPA